MLFFFLQKCINKVLKNSRKIRDHRNDNLYFLYDLKYFLSHIDSFQRQFLQTSFLLQPEPRPQKIDKQVIDGHVIPNEVLFTSPTPDSMEYKTLVFSDNLKVIVSFLKAHNKGNDNRSNTLEIILIRGQFI